MPFSRENCILKWATTILIYEHAWCQNGFCSKLVPTEFVPFDQRTIMSRECTERNQEFHPQAGGLDNLQILP